MRSSPELRHDMARPRSKAVHSPVPSSACVPASTPWTRCLGLAGCSGSSTGASLPPRCPSASCAGRRCGSAGGRAPGGGWDAAGAGAHGRVLELASLLRRDPAGSSRASASWASAIASSGLSGAGAPGRRVVVGSMLDGTRAPFGWRPSSNRTRDSIARHSPGIRVWVLCPLSRWALQPSHFQTTY